MKFIWIIHENLCRMKQKYVLSLIKKCDNLHKYPPWKHYYIAVKVLYNYRAPIDFIKFKPTPSKTGCVWSYISLRNLVIFNTYSDLKSKLILFSWKKLLTTDNVTSSNIKLHSSLVQFYKRRLCSRSLIETKLQTQKRNS